MTVPLAVVVNGPMVQRGPVCSVTVVRVVIPGRRDGSVPTAQVLWWPALAARGHRQRNFLLRTRVKTPAVSKPSPTEKQARSGPPTTEPARRRRWWRSTAAWPWARFLRKRVWCTCTRRSSRTGRPPRCDTGCGDPVGGPDVARGWARGVRHYPRHLGGHIRPATHPVITARRYPRRQPRSLPDSAKGVGRLEARRTAGD